jgi:hypothetical protein
VVAPEDLGELRRLPVAHRRGHILDRERSVEQELGGARHPDALQLAAEAGAARLGEGALKLPPRGRDLVRHARKRELLIAVAPRDHGARLPVEITSSLHGGWPH